MWARERSKRVVHSNSPRMPHNAVEEDSFKLSVNPGQVWLTLWFARRSVGLISRWQPVHSIATVRQQRRSLTVSHAVNDGGFRLCCCKSCCGEQKWFVKVKLQEESHDFLFFFATRKSTTKITKTRDWIGPVSDELGRIEQIILSFFN